MDRGMKNKTHLLYGIIIGILLCACVGSSIDDQKEFKEIQRVYWNNDEEAFVRMLEKDWSGIETLVPSPEGSPDDLREAGWTIIDMEYDSQAKRGTDYLIGK